MDHGLLAERFTLSVAEIEAVHVVGQELQDVVVGEVLTALRIRETKLRLCQVDAGLSDVIQVVCGAPNVARGQKIALVLAGTQLGDLVVEERRVQGELSQGMIASLRELDLGDDHAGILVLPSRALPGAPLANILPVRDVIFEIDNKSLTHRPDLWGHRGIAREVAAIIGRDLEPLSHHVPFPDGRPLSVHVQDTATCPRYVAATLEGVTVGPSPFWLQLLLHRVGVRPINNVVDATNFVMHDLGNPLHAFDRREIKGDTITVRAAGEGEIFTTLDGVERTLDPRDLLIADGERAVALAGVMGGENSEIRPDTTHIVLEAANFDPAGVRMTSQRLGLRTDSSVRFEKALDPHLPVEAARAFCQVLKSLDPEVTLTSALLDASGPLPEPTWIDLSVSLVAKRLGTAVTRERITEILTSLSFEIEGDDEDVLRVRVPTFRATKDVAIPEDLIEEVGRVIGYDHIEPRPPAIVLGRPHPHTRKRMERAAGRVLTQAYGFDEVMTYSFASDPLLIRIHALPEHRIRLKNPISAEMPALRTTLGPQLLGVLSANARETDDIRVFEMGRVFHPAQEAGELPVQPTVLGVLCASPEWSEDPDAAAFFGMKGLLGALARTLERPVPRLEATGVTHRWAHPGRQATLHLAEHQVGYVAEIHPQTLQQLGVRQGGALLEIDFDRWREAEPEPLRYRPLHRFPAVYRDFAVVVAESVRSEEVASAIRGASDDLIDQVTFQSAYRGKGIADDHKCLAWSVTLRHPERTLTDAEARDVEEAVWVALAQAVRGARRA